MGKNIYSGTLAIREKIIKRKENITSSWIHPRKIKNYSQGQDGDSVDKKETSGVKEGIINQTWQEC